MVAAIRTYGTLFTPERPSSHLVVPLVGLGDRLGVVDTQFDAVLRLFGPAHPPGIEDVQRHDPVGLGDGAREEPDRVAGSSSGVRTAVVQRVPPLSDHVDGPGPGAVTLHEED